MPKGQKSDGGGVSAFIDVPRSELERLIDEWVLNERDRYVLKRRLLDGVTYERLSYELEQNTQFIGVSARQLQSIVRRGVAILIKRLKTS